MRDTASGAVADTPPCRAAITGGWVTRFQKMLKAHDDRIDEMKKQGHIW